MNFALKNCEFFHGECKSPEIKVGNVETMTEHRGTFPALGGIHRNSRILGKTMGKKIKYDELEVWHSLKIGFCENKCFALWLLHCRFDWNGKCSTESAVALLCPKSK